MPFRTEHSVRVRSPRGYDRFRRKTLAGGVDAIIGFRDGGSEIQALRFDAGRFTPAAARRWAEGHGFRVMRLEPAKPLTVKIAILTKSAAELRYTLAVVYEPGVLDTQGDFASAETIRAAAWDFTRRLQARSDVERAAAGVVKALLDTAAVEAEVDITALADAVERGAIGDMHDDFEHPHGEIVENYVAPADFVVEGETVKAGTWCVGIVWSPEMFERIRRGERRGVSMGGTAMRVEREPVAA